MIVSYYWCYETALLKLVTNCDHVELKYLLSPYACGEGNMPGVNGTGMDEARCESDPCWWKGTELLHLVTLLLQQIPKNSYHDQSLAIACEPNALTVFTYNVIPAYAQNRRPINTIIITVFSFFLQNIFHYLLLPFFNINTQKSQLNSWGTVLHGKLVFTQVLMKFSGSMELWLQDPIIELIPSQFKHL